MAKLDKDERGEIIKVLGLCVLWYSISSGNNVVGKMLLNEFPYPMTVTMIQLLSITCYSGPVLTFFGIRRQTDISWNYYKIIVLPLAIGKCLASVFSHVSLWKVPVSYAHTVKATMPLFTVILSRLCFGEKQTFLVYLSLAPIILGVSIATITELSFDVIGLVAALSSTCGFSLQNIFSKKVLNDTGIHPLRLLHLLGKLSLLMFLPVWILFDGYSMVYDAHLVARRSGSITLLLLVIDGGLSWLQNLVAFSLLHRIAPLTYAVASASKRVAIVSVSLFVLGNPVTLLNVLGMVLAILGVLGYNKAKYDANMALKRLAMLPVTASVPTPPLHQMHPAYHYDYTKDSSTSTTALLTSARPLHITDITNGFYNATEKAIHKNGVVLSGWNSNMGEVSWLNSSSSSPAGSNGGLRYEPSFGSSAAKQHGSVMNGKVRSSERNYGNHASLSVST